MTTRLLLLTLLAAPLAAQTLLHSHTPPASWNVQRIRTAGDTNGDGIDDAVVLIEDNALPTTVWRVVIVSGADASPLHTISDPAFVNLIDAAGFGDADGDVRSDIAVVRDATVRVYSGSTGGFLYAVPQPPNADYRGVCELGDFDGNGRADFALACYAGAGNHTFRLVRGDNGGLLASLPNYQTGAVDCTLRPMGDLNGDGKVDLALVPSSGPVLVVNSVGGGILLPLPVTPNDNGRSLETLDLDGDGKRELFLLRPYLGAGNGTTGIIQVHNGGGGALRFTLRATPGLATSLGAGIAAIGDLDQDGVVDFVIPHGAPGASHLEATSGRTGTRLWRLDGWHPAYDLTSALCGIGDADGDGYGDVLITEYSPGGWRWHVLSSRVRAESQPQTGACGGGPFFPQLGATRPVLGQAMTIVGQNGPVGVGGVLVFSLRPTFPTWLGVSSCFAWFDLGAGIALAPLTQPQWSVQLPLPLVPQFAGLEIALQDFYSPTAGPLGYDLSNGVSLRLGYQ